MNTHDFQEFADEVMADPVRRANAERERQEALTEIIEYAMGAEEIQHGGHHSRAHRSH